MAGGCPVVIAQWQSTGCTSQVSWVQFSATAGLSLSLDHNHATSLVSFKWLSYYLLVFAVVGGVVAMAAMAGIICCTLYRKYKRRKNKGKISITIKVLYSFV